MARAIAIPPQFFIHNNFSGSESGNVLSINGLAIPLASIKDIKACVESAHRGLAQWAAFNPHQRTDILYQMARCMELHAAVISEQLKSVGISSLKIVLKTLINFHYSLCGWPGKLETLLSSVNAISQKHVSYTIPEPVGCIAVLPDISTSFLELWTKSLTLLCSGNAVILCVPFQFANAVRCLCEQLLLCKLPAGVLNIVFINGTSLFDKIASHRGIDALMCDFVPQDNVISLMAEHQMRLLPWDKNSDFETLQTSVQYKTIWTPMDLFQPLSNASY
ncbi:MAG: aldehyde dehydrogenase family protein [Bacteroidota bacterium]